MLRKEIDYVPLVKKSIIALISGVIMYGVVRLAERLPFTGITLLAIQVVIGVVTYGVACLALHMAFDRDLLEMARAKRGKKAVQSD